MPEITVNLPRLHSGQERLFHQQTRLNSVRCGRRWGKTRFLEYLAAQGACNGLSVGVFAPEYKQLAEPWDHLIDTLDPVKKTANKNDGTIKTVTGGKVDFWTLNDNDLAGRGREYNLVLIDEAGFTKSPQMKDIWFKSIKPTMLTTKGIAWVFSTPNGVDPDNFFYAACNDEELNFTNFHAPTITNPYVPPEELERERERNHPLVFKQEYLAEFIDWSGVAFFSLDKMLVNGEAVPYPTTCDGVYAVLDTAVKGGKENDGTAIVYISVNSQSQHPLTILDWDIIQVDGAMLERWMPSVFMRLDDLAALTGARKGSVGVFIEDAAAGAILLQQGKARGWPTYAIDSKLTNSGKDERAISVSGYFHQEKLKISSFALNKTVSFKGATRNHLVTQLASFRLGDKEAFRRADDLLDAVVYALAVGVGNKYGY